MVLPDSENLVGICAYYRLFHTEVKRQTLPASLAKILPHYPVSVMRIAQLAVDKMAQGQWMGKLILIRALQ